MDTAYNTTYKIKITNDLERKLRIIGQGIKGLNLGMQEEYNIHILHLEYLLNLVKLSIWDLMEHGKIYEFQKLLKIPGATNKLSSSVKLGH